MILVVSGQLLKGRRQSEELSPLSSLSSLSPRPRVSTSPRPRVSTSPHPRVP